MIPSNFKSTKICEELSEADCKKYFNFKQKKYLHNMDSLYYGILLKNVSDYFIEQLHMDQQDCNFSDCKTSSIDSSFVILPSGVRFYKYILKKPNYYRILICPSPPNSSTPQIQVQLNSEYLWLDGVEKAFEESFYEIKSLLKKYHMLVEKVTVNRCDFAWHTNYMRNMNKFNDLETVSKMKLSTLTRYDLEGAFVGSDGFECDYLRFGRLKSNNIIFRMYNKSKEVVEESKKFWFFPIWHESGLVNLYDLLVYEKIAKYGSWRKKDLARLDFYLDYGDSDFYKMQIKDIKVKGEKNDSYDYVAIEELANFLTPKINVIVNNEFQVMRKFLSTVNFENYNNRSDETAEMLLLFDNWINLTSYITQNVLRFVEYKGENLDKKKGRRSNLPFWEQLRKTKIYNVDNIVKNSKIVRDYNNNLNADCVKRNFLSSVAAINTYYGYEFESEMEDFSNCIAELNDNDFNSLKNFRNKKRRLLNVELDKKSKKDYKIVREKKHEN